MTWYYNRKTMTKLILAFLVICGIVGAMGGLGAKGTITLRDNLDRVYNGYTVAATDLCKSSTNLMRYRNNGILMGGTSSRAEFDQIASKQPAIRKTIADSLDAYAASGLLVSRTGRDEAKDLEKFRKALDGYLDAAEITTAFNTQAWDAKTDEERLACKEKARLNTIENSGPKLDQAIGALDELLMTCREIAGDLNDDGVKAASASLWTTSIGTGTSIVLSLLLGYFLARIIARPLAKSVEVLSAVARGDFTQTLDVNTKDEVGQMAQALNQAVAGVRGALTEVRVVAEGLASASQQLSAASQEISSGAQEQASNLEETASSLEEITSTVRQNADNAQQANQLASRSREVAEKGGQVVHNAVAGMGEINKASKQIADIITAIDEIAFQTNLLALNAAVEAARAGEQGRGFAVVAGEVRNLAQRSAGAAKEIKGLIQDSVRKVEAGSDLVNQSGETLQEIVTSVKRVTDIVGEIAAASREQSTGIDQVSKAVAQMDQVTQTNASQTEELSGTAESLAGQAHQLQELVARFRLDSDGAIERRPAATSKSVAIRSGGKRPGKAGIATARSGDTRDLEKRVENDLELIAAGVAENGQDGFAEF